MAMEVCAIRPAPASEECLTWLRAPAGSATMATMAKKPSDDEWLDALFAAPPRAFVSERKRVAAELKAAGRNDEARAAAKLKRPSASVWAVNQLARRAPDELADLLDLGAALRAGERKLMRGGAAGDFMTEARTARQKVAALARRAEAALSEEGGQKSTLALSRKIAQTLHAASIGDDEIRARLQAGRLEHDLAPPSSFGGDSTSLTNALAASVAASPKSHAPKPAGARARAHAKARAHAHAAEDDAATAAAARKRAAAERKASAAALRAGRREQAAARKQAAAHARAAAAADRVVAERQRAVEKARAAVEHAERDLRAAKDALTDAETAATAAHRAAADRK
jgi:hypothetical protein